MNQNDIELKKTAQLIGIALLLFLLLFYGAYSVFELIITPIIYVAVGETLGQTIAGIGSGLVYAAVFILPALLFARLNKNANNGSCIHYAPRFPAKLAPCIIMATVAVSISCAYVNSWLATAFGVANNLELSTEPISLLGFVVLIFKSAVVPAVCEEFLFRKTLLPAMLPYGEGFAIFSSAILFGLMHQNILQIFYTTMAGILLGYVYTKTRSYLCVFLIHFTNNFVSVLQTVFVSNLSEPYATAAVATLTATVISLGVISAIVLILKEKSDKDVYSSGSFEKILPPSPDFVSKYTLQAPSKTLFLSPSVLIFAILSASSCISQLFS